MATLEKALKEIDTYENISTEKKQLWKELCEKLWPLLNIEPGICCNEDMDSAMIWKDDKFYYFDIELNQDSSNGEDGTNFSLYVKNRISDGDLWLESFTPDEVTPEWVMQYLNHFALRKA